jgi:Tol biopolymer transport system component
MVRAALVVRIVPLILLLADCHDDQVAPSTGELAISAVTTGVDLDPDGYTVAVDGGAGTAILSNGTITLADLSPGDHQLTLSGLDDNCALQEATPLRVSVPEASRATTTLHISCTYANTLAYVQDNTVYITAVAPGSTPRPIADGYSGVAWSPDGSTLALVPSAPPKAIYLVDANGGNRRQLTRTYDDRDLLRTPVWSPDGRILLFEFHYGFSPLSGIHPHLIRINSDGSDEGFFIPEEEVYGSENPDWSPDGAHVALDTGGEICIYAPAGVEERCLTRGYDPSWSPDGARLAFSVGPFENPLDQFQIHTIAIDGNNERNLSPPVAPMSGELGPDWSPDGTKLLFHFFDYSSNPADSRAYIVDPDGGNRLDLAPGLYVGPTAWSRDGSRVALVVGEPFSEMHLYTVSSDGTGLSLLGAAGDITSIAWRP